MRSMVPVVVAALPICVPRHACFLCSAGRPALRLGRSSRRVNPAPSTGFGPAISCVTGRRALQAAPRGHDRSQWLRWESNRAPPRSGGRIPGSKPRWSAGCLPSRKWSRMESNHRFLGVDQVSLPLDHGTVFFQVESPGVAPGSPACGAGVVLLDHDPLYFLAEAVGLEPTSGILAATCFQDRFLIRPDGFRYQAAEAGVEPTRRRSERLILPLDDSASFARRDTARRLQARGGGVEPPSPGSKPGSLPLADPRSTSRECPVGVEPGTDAKRWSRQLGRLAPLPLGQGHIERKERESNPQGSSLGR